MRLKEAIQHTSGLRCVVEGMEICSSVGRRMLHEMTWLGEESAITAEHDRITSVLRLLETEEGRDRTETIRRKLALLRDIRSTIERTGGNCVFDDIELFELKFFALLAEELRPLASQGRLAELPELNGVVDLLDPEGNRLPHFFVYDAYSEELTTLRKQIKARKQAGADESQVQELYFRSVEIEDCIRERLSVELRKYHKALQQALDLMGWLDVVIAKAMQARDWGLTRPAITQDTASFRGLFNPELRISLEAAGKRFQPVNIRLTTGPTVITGANMSGKTVLLHSVELAQYMLQFGFYIAAERAEMALVDEVHCSIGDGQDQLSGLSSFAAEMMRMDELAKSVRAGRRVLALIDERLRSPFARNHPLQRHRGSVPQAEGKRLLGNERGGEDHAEKHQRFHRLLARGGHDGRSSARSDPDRPYSGHRPGNPPANRTQRRTQKQPMTAAVRHSLHERYEKQIRNRL